MFTSKEYRSIARAKLRGAWGSSILITLLALLLGGFYGGSINLNLPVQTERMDEISAAFEEYIQEGFPTSPEELEDFDIEEFHRNMPPEIWDMLLVSVGVMAIAGVIALIRWIIGGAVELGHNRYYISLVLENKSEKPGIIFSRFHIFGKALLLRLYISLKVYLWALAGLGATIVIMILAIESGMVLLTILLIAALNSIAILAIMAAYRYTLAPYLMAENPEIGVRESVRQSKALMKGHKWRYFCLNLSFIGWSILAGLAWGIGHLALNPYKCAAHAAFYIDRTGRNIPFAGQPVYEQQAQPGPQPRDEQRPQNEQPEGWQGE